MTQDNDDKCYEISNADFFFCDMLMHVYDSCSNNPSYVQLSIET